MPDKILSAISPAYGIATGTGPIGIFLALLAEAYMIELLLSAKMKKEKKKKSENLMP